MEYLSLEAVGEAPVLAGFCPAKKPGGAEEENQVVTRSSFLCSLWKHSIVTEKLDQQNVSGHLEEKETGAALRMKELL